MQRLVRAVPTGLRKRLLFLVLASVLPFVVLIGLVARRHLLDQKPVAAAHARANSSTLAEQLDAKLRTIGAAMRNTANFVTADPAEKPSNDRALRMATGNLPGETADWSLYAQGGRLAGGPPPRDGEPDGKFLWTEWQRRGARFSPFVTEPVLLHSGQTIHIVLPMRDSRGADGLLVAPIPLRLIRPTLTGEQLPTGTSLAVISERGVIVARHPDPDRWVGFNISGTPLERAVRTAPGGVAEVTTQDSVQRVVGVARMTEVPWLVGTGIPLTAVYAQSRADFARAIGWGMLALTLALVMAMWQASRIIAPLAQLSADAATLGTGNLAHRSGVLGRDEFGALAATINEMATTLEQQGAVLRESEERYRGLFDINPLPMWVLDPESLAFLAVNRAATEAYGYSEEEFRVMKVSDIRPAEDVPALLTHLAQSGAKAQRYVTRHRRKDGTVFQVEIDSGAITFAGRPARLVVVHDVSERVRAEEALRDAEVQLRQSQRLEAIGQLTGGIAHDFNNVLTAIGSYSDFLYESLDAGDARRLDIQEIRKAADRAAGLTKQLLAFSRSQILQPRVLDINVALVELEALLKRLLSADLELVFALAPDAGHVRADPGQLAQVVINLAVNARDAMPDGGVLTISTRNETVLQTRAVGPSHRAVPPGDYVAIEVVDTGTGMDPETLGRIFEPFFTTKGPGEGTGLGLSTAHGIIHQSGGFISAESQPGVGTTFTILLPRVNQPVEPDQPTPERAVAGNRDEIVLVVEDEEAVRRAAKRILVKKGYTVLEAANGNEALEQVAAQPRIDLLLTDLVMPGMGGRELVRVLRERNRAMPTLYMSGYTKDAVMRAELDPDIMVLEKPFSQEELASKVREVLDKNGRLPNV
ncbi:MAG TPA: ATP-binding protein [Gemmatimonadaceae bacterium]|nr:ATP-binding protein [Gemmatimonadaceae bacterium]